MNKAYNIIPVFFAVDDAYVPFLVVALQSLIENSSKENNYMIRILYTEISEKNKEIISSKYYKDNIEIEFVDLNSYIEEIKSKLHTRDYYSKTTYYRLFIPELYPEYDKAIYLDSDILIKSDIAELYKIDLGDNLLGAVTDEVIQSEEVFKDYVEKVIGVLNSKNYFNAGVLVMNLKELRKSKFQKKFIHLLEHVKYEVVQDEDYLNRICKGRVKILDKSWNKMPIGGDNIERENINIIHYTLTSKPWHYDNILYGEYFWDYASRTEYLEDIKNIKENFDEEKQAKDIQETQNLKKLAQFESDCVGDDRYYPKSKIRIPFIREIEKEEKMQNRDREERLYKLEKIKNLEEKGIFDIDVEDDPPTVVLTPENVDYLKKKSSSKIKNKVANKMGEKFLNDLLKENKLIIKRVNGIENLQKVKSGAMLTCNHFNPFDSFAIEKVFRISGQSKMKKLYKVIREGNYTNFPGLYGFFFRNCDTLPLSSNKKTMIEFMKAVDIILQRGDFILIYPEQSLWWNYKKPKPLKNGAFKLAARNDCPVIPIFITMEDSKILGEDGFPIQEYTINIEKPIYPNNKLTDRENAEKMKEKNAEIWKKVYEKFYKIPLEYTCDKKENVK